MKAWPLPRGSLPPFIGRPPHLHPLASRAKSPLTSSRVLPLRHRGWDPHVIRADPKHEEGEPPQARHVTVPWLQALSHLRRNRWSKGWTAPQLCAPSAPSPSGGPAQRKRARMSCNRCTGYDVQEATTPLTPMLRLLDCGTSTVTRGTPARDPTVPIKGDGHGSVSRGVGTTVGMIKSGPIVTAAADERRQQSSRLQARVPS
jgi:hypothetical protein